MSTLDHDHDHDQADDAEQAEAERKQREVFEALSDVGRWHRLRSRPRR